MVCRRSREPAKPPARLHQTPPPNRDRAACALGPHIPAARVPSLRLAQLATPLEPAHTPMRPTPRSPRSSPATPNLNSIPADPADCSHTALALSPTSISQPRSPSLV